MNKNFAFLSNLIFGNDIKVCEGLVHECGDVSCFLKDFGICVVVNKLQQFVEYLLDVVDFFKV